MLVFTDKSTHEEHLSQPLQTNNKQFKIAVTFLTGYNGFFNVTNSNNKFCFTTPFSDIQPIFIIIKPGVCELESLDAEINRISINDRYFREDGYPFRIKPNFSKLGSNIEIDVGIGRQISFTHNVIIRDLLGFKPKVVPDECILSDYPVDILSFDNIFLECDIAQGMIFRGKRSGIIRNFMMDVDPGYKNIEKTKGGVPIRLQNKAFAFCFEEASLSTTIGSDIEQKKICGQVSTVM